MAMACGGSVRAQDAAGAAPGLPGGVRDPIVVAADVIQTWEDAGGRWILLSGPSKVAVLQGIEGLRARQAVMRVKGPEAPGLGPYQAEVYAEGDVVPVGPRVPTVPTMKMSLRSNLDIRLKPYGRGGLKRLAGPPADFPIVRRGFPQAMSTSNASRVTEPRPEVVAGAPSPPSREVRTGIASPAPAAEELPMAVVPAPPAAVGRGLPMRPDVTTGPVAVASEASPARSPLAQDRPSGNPPVMPLAPAASSPSLKMDSPRTVVRADRSSSGMAGPATGEVTPVQFEMEDGLGGFGASATDDLPAPVELPEASDADEERPPSGASPYVRPNRPDLMPPLEGPGGNPGQVMGPGTDLEPLPGPDGRPMTPIYPETIPEAGPKVKPPPLVILPGSERITRFFPRNGGPNYESKTLREVDGVSITMIRGGVQIISESKEYGLIDVSADSAIIWRRVDAKSGRGLVIGPNNEQIEDAGQPMEVYLEGNVEFRQDERKVAGNGDQKTFKAKQAYFDFRTSRFVALEGEANLFGPGLIAPMRMFAPRIDQFRPLKRTPDGKIALGREEIHADDTLTTGSRFPTPGYSFTSSSSDIKRVVSTHTEPNSGRPVGNPRDPKTPEDLTWRIDSRQNVFWLGSVPVFYWPRILTNADDIEPPLRAFIFRTNNYFGQQFLADFNGFRLLGIDRPKWIDQWNVDVDELTARGLALGSEIGWFGRGLLNDLRDPYRSEKSRKTDPGGDYFGYFDIWGLQDHGNDVLGSGPAVITNNNAAANKGYQRVDVPAFQNFRGKVTARHMQFLIDPEAEQDEDFRLQLELGFSSDRHFIEEYYKRIFDTGLDQETLAYMIRQKENRAWSVWTEANLNNWYTDTQWLPRGDYYRFGDSLLNNWFTYSQHSGADYANTHKAAEVNNPYIFAFLPYDPISNTSQDLSAGRLYTTHELDMPWQFDFVRVIPYVQGQAVGWSNQINGSPVGRIWGAAGARASIMAWRAFPGVESELFNVHGLNHKINLDVDARDAWSNVKLDQIGVQDDLDDNTYEYVRRYFALTNYAGGLLPQQYDPRHLILRRALSPIAGPTDIQASIETVQLNLHQRLQTKRGPEGRRRVIDYMTLDLSTTYFPYSTRDNFGKNFGQNMYNWQWFLGDRTSIVSYGWFEFWNIGGQPIFNTNVNRHNDPFGLNVITSGISINRPPRGTAYIGYTVINTGPINTSALTTSVNYWLSPKWYGSYSTMYDFGNAILLASMFSFTRIGADYLTTIGLTVDPQRNSYMFAFMLSPRLSPNIRFGSGLGLSQFDSRYAPTQ
jgi:hypothetical protein